MAQTLTLRPELVIEARFQAGRILNESPQLDEPRLSGGGVSGQLVKGAPRRRQIAPCAAELGAALQLLLAHERVEDVELVRRAGKAPLLELPRHRDEALGRAGDVLAGG